MNPRTTHVRRAAAAGLALAATLTLAACGQQDAPASAGEAPASVSQAGDASPYKGTELDRPFAKPDLKLTDDQGKPFDLRKDTAGRSVLLFFGYTNCPDVCPTTLSDVALALREQPEEVREKTSVVFVSTDPERDTPKVLDKWLASFDASYTGLTGDLEQVKTAAKSLGITVDDPKHHDDGTVTSSHGPQLVAFLPTTNQGHVVYSSGTPTASFAHDLPLLARGKQSTAG
ncbi:SCO family protein [Streptomyces sp. SID9913]|uniref:SCO family protein n=1 Tax=Streptomyces sp. SID9913 TaxID=2706117 RepID=UPI0013DC24DD|nr:SCO family protein [Streptomyces sp. SID9913]NED19834.1 SCO family protein [Streptomyces sp. SID9913]